jgi:hypothetical protein
MENSDILWQWCTPQLLRQPVIRAYIADNPRLSPLLMSAADANADMAAGNNLRFASAPTHALFIDIRSWAYDYVASLDLPDVDDVQYFERAQFNGKLHNPKQAELVFPTSTRGTILKVGQGWIKTEGTYTTLKSLPDGAVLLSPRHYERYPKLKKRVVPALGTYDRITGKLLPSDQQAAQLHQFRSNSLDPEVNP